MTYTGLREAVPEDNEMLLALERRSPQGSGLKMHSERRDYFYRGRLFGNHRTVVALDHGRVFGVLAATEKTVRLGDRDEPAVMFYDLRLDPDYRSNTLGRHMLLNWRRMETWAEETGARVIYGMVKADNTAMAALQLRHGGYHFGGRMRIVSRAVYRQRRVQTQPDLVDLRDENVTMGEAVAAEYGRLSLFPADLRNRYLTPEMQDTGLFSCYRLREVDSWASVGLYRVSREIWTRVVKLPWYYRVAGPLARAVEAVVPLPHIPRPGDQMRYHHVFNHLAHGPRGIDLWKQIIAHITNVALEEGSTLLTGMFDPTDRFCNLFRRGALNLIDYRIGYRTLGSDRTYSLEPFAPDVRDMD